jgi:hypothetical protein
MSVPSTIAAINFSTFDARRYGPQFTQATCLLEARKPSTLALILRALCVGSPLQIKDQHSAL